MCCLFGMIDYGDNFTGTQKSKLLSILAKECEERGTDAAGIAYCAGKRLVVYKRPVPARKLHFHIPKDCKTVMGHTRMATQGLAKKNYNNHPFPGKVGNTNFALAHNGVLSNDDFLREHLNLPSTNIETDSYIAVQLLEQKAALDFSSLADMAETVKGSFTFTILDDQECLYVVRGNNPFCLYHFSKSGLYLYASTEAILNRALQKMRISLEKPQIIGIKEGDILRINHYGLIDHGNFEVCSYSNWDIPRQGRIPSYSYRPQSLYEQEYLRSLRYAASTLGYDENTVDHLMHQGFSIMDLEELLYGGGLHYADFGY